METTHPIAARLAAAARHIREERHWTQDTLAERLGVTRQMVSFLERGQLKSINLEMLAALDRFHGDRCIACGELRDPGGRMFERAVRHAQKGGKRG